MLASKQGWRRYGPMSLLLAGLAAFLYAILAVTSALSPDGVSESWSLARDRFIQASTFMVIPAAHIGGVMLAFRSFVTEQQGWGFGVAGLALNGAGLGLSALVILTRQGLGPV